MSPRDLEFQAADISDLTGYIAIVTGGNSGIGYETTLQLAKKGARVYIAARSDSRVAEAISRLNQAESGLDVRFLKLDLQSFQSVQSAATEFLQKESRLDILINNAGIMASPYELTKDGCELQWQTCFLSHHAFTLSLLPALRQAASFGPSKQARARIVNVSSDAAFAVGPNEINYEDPNLSHLTSSISPWQRYGHCKQANIIAAKALDARYRQYGIAAYSLHPGIIKTNLQRHDTTIWGTLARIAVKFMPVSSVETGALNSLCCATSPEVANEGGKFFAPVGKVSNKADKWINNKESVDKLWDLAMRQLTDHGFLFEA